MSQPFAAIDSNNNLPAVVRERLASNLGNPSTVEGGALSATIAGAIASNGGIDQGQALLSKLATETGNPVIAIAGDSTGNEPVEWADLSMAALGAERPDLRVEIAHWNDTAQGYDAPTVTQPGASLDPTPEVVFQDAFTRTAADIVGTSPDVGPLWAAEGGNSLGNWILDGSSAVSTAKTPRGPVLADGGKTGKFSLALKVTLTATVGVNLVVGAKVLNAGNYLSLDLLRGGSTFQPLLYKTLAGASRVQIAAGAFTPYTAGSALDVLLVVDGTTFTATINGTTISATLSQAEADALAGATNVTLSPSAAGVVVDDFTLTVVSDASTVQKLTLLNGSVPGSSLAYQQARIAEMYPPATKIDLLLVSSCHNYGTTLPASYLGMVDDFIAAYRAVHPESGIVISSQNPQKSPAVNALQHRERLAALASYAKRRGHGYLPVIEKWWALPLHGSALVKADGIHPTAAPTAEPNGSTFWRDVFMDYLSGLE